MLILHTRRTDPSVEVVRGQGPRVTGLRCRRSGGMQTSRRTQPYPAALLCSQTQYATTPAPITPKLNSVDPGAPTRAFASIAKDASRNTPGTHG